MSLHYLLTPAAFAFFLPALIRIAESGRSERDASPTKASTLAGSLVQSLCGMAQGDLSEKFLALRNFYTTKQLNEVTKFIKEETIYDGSFDFESVRHAIKFWENIAR